MRGYNGPAVLIAHNNTPLSSSVSDTAYERARSECAVPVKIMHDGITLKQAQLSTLCMHFIPGVSIRKKPNTDWYNDKGLFELNQEKSYPGPRDRKSYERYPDRRGKALLIRMLRSGSRCEPYSGPQGRIEACRLLPDQVPLPPHRPAGSDKPVFHDNEGESEQYHRQVGPDRLMGETVPDAPPESRGIMGVVSWTDVLQIRFENVLMVQRILLQPFLQPVHDSACIVKPSGRPFPQGLSYDPAVNSRDSRIDPPDRRVALVDYLFEYICLVILDKRFQPGEQFIKKDPKRKNIR